MLYRAFLIILYKFDYFCSFLAAVTIGFVNPNVMVRENEGPAGLQVGILAGNLDSEIQLQVTTRDGSATCE